MQRELLRLMTPGISLDATDVNRLLGALTQGFTDLRGGFDQMRHENATQHGDLMHQHGELVRRVDTVAGEVADVKSEIAATKLELRRLRKLLRSVEQVNAGLQKDTKMPNMTVHILAAIVTALYGDMMTGAHVHGFISRFAHAFLGK